MILRNPAPWRDSFFRIMGLVTIMLSGSFSLRSQGIAGTVLEAFSRHPVPHAQVKVSLAGVFISEVYTDSLGRYQCPVSEAGRLHILIEAAGFNTYSKEDVMADGYSMIRLEHLLEKTTFDLPGVTVTAISGRNTTHVHRIEPGDMVLVAGNFEDPVRIAHSQPGIILMNDQANHLSARGQSPLLNSWYLEELEIVNPNHTNNAGTFSDQPTQSGGGVNLFSNQILSTTDIYTGLTPLSIGRQEGAVIDFHLHESARSEWRAKAGLIGMELGGAFAAGTSSVLDFNLRYSFTGILTGLGADFGGEKIGFYDGVAAYTHSGASHKLKLFAWAGASENKFDRVEALKDRERYKDFFDIDFASDIYGAGVRYDLSLGASSLFRTGAAYSQTKDQYNRDGIFGLDTVDYRRNSAIRVLSVFAEWSGASSSRLHSAAGIRFTSKWYDNLGYYLPLFEEYKIRPYAEVDWRLTSALAIELGGELSIGGANLTSSSGTSLVPGFRGMLHWYPDRQFSWFAGISQTSGQSVIGDSGDKQIRVQKIETGWRWAKARHAVLVDLYYHTQQRLSVNRIWPEGYIHLADMFDPGYNIAFYLNSDGVARQYGIEGQWDLTHEKGWRFSVNQTVYRSLRGLEDEDLTAGRFDGRYATHLSIAKEITRLKKGKHRTWNFSMRGLLHGGFWEEEIDSDLSGMSNTTVFVNRGTFTQQLRAYRRIDLSVARTIAYPNVRWRYSLDIQNAFGFSNTAFHEYDPFLGSIVTKEHLGLIPVFSVQAFW